MDSHLASNSTTSDQKSLLPSTPRDAILQALISLNLPFTAAEDEYFIHMLKICGEVKVVQNLSADTYRRDLDKMFDLHISEVKVLLQVR